MVEGDNLYYLLSLGIEMNKNGDMSVKTSLWNILTRLSNDNALVRILVTFNFVVLARKSVAVRLSSALHSLFSSNQSTRQ